MTRCKNSRTNKGSVSVETGDRNKRLLCVTEKRTVGGFILGRYINEGRGVECAR